jgi:hypothetical protein
VVSRRHSSLTVGDLPTADIHVRVRACVAYRTTYSLVAVLRTW